MNLNAYLGVTGLNDVEFAFYDFSESIIGSWISGVSEAGNGWYVASREISGNANSIRWDSISNHNINAREYFDPYKTYISGKVSYIYDKFQATPSGAVIVIGTPTSGSTLGYLYTYDSQANIDPKVSITFTLESIYGSGLSYDVTPFTGISNNDGLLEATFVPSGRYLAQRTSGKSVGFMTPGSGAFLLPIVLGLP